jgi:hypothetical protein
MRRYIAIETAISVVINVGFSALFFFLVFGRTEQIALWGPGGFAFDYFPQTFMITLMGVIVPTILTRKRVSAGKVPRRESAFADRLPRNVVLRALLLGAVAAAVLGAVAVLITDSLWSGQPAHSDLRLLKLAYGAVVAAIMTPIGLVAALSDGRAKETAPSPAT